MVSHRVGRSGTFSRGLGFRIFHPLIEKLTMSPLPIPVSEEIRLLGVADRGVPNKERILAKALAPIQLGSYVLTTGVLSPEGHINLIPNLLFLFDHFDVQTGSWIVAYTGKGKQEISRLPTSLEPAYVFHWGFDGVLFTRTDIVPALLRIDALNYEGSSVNPPLDMADQRLVEAPLPVEALTSGDGKV
jgi:hypothetical protein